MEEHYVPGRQILFSLGQASQEKDSSRLTVFYFIVVLVLYFVPRWGFILSFTQFSLFKVSENLLQWFKNTASLGNLSNNLLGFYFFLISIFKYFRESPQISPDSKNCRTHKSLFVIPFAFYTMSVLSQGIICSASLTLTPM